MDQNNQAGQPLYEQVMNNQASTANQTMESVMYEDGTISRRAYNIIIGFVVLWGVGIDTAICMFFGDKLTETFNNNWVMVLIYIGMVIAGTIIVSAAKNPVISFIGYNILVIGFGITLAMVVGMYMPAIVLEAFLVTTIVTAVMLLLGTLWQDMFMKIGRVLFVGLIALVIVEFVMILVTGTFPTWISVVSAILFSGFIGYDWSKAQKSTPTAKNAVLAGTSLYVDIINLFLDILRIVGKD
ncbi:MAG: Bax inhibitor-1 family protein [Eubacterium sp.]|nr:Bax inhibitor-1 family protein [Eubacterium sp.]